MGVDDGVVGHLTADAADIGDGGGGSLEDVGEELEVPRLGVGVRWWKGEAGSR